MIERAPIDAPGNEELEVSDGAMLPQSPVVSVLMITYNHGEYLAEAIEGVLAQQCDFPFELIIGEDASADHTLQVALDYQRRYPGIVRVVHGPRNVGINANGLRVYQRARGKYLAFCEGDDFWCAPGKLAGQVALLEADETIGIVHTDWTKAVNTDGRWRYDRANSVHRRVAGRFLRGDLSGTWHFPKILRTCTVMVPRTIFQAMVDSGLYRPEFRFGDSILNAFVTAQWNVGYLPDVTAVYRVSPNSALRSGAAERVTLYRSCLAFDDEARHLFHSRTGYAPGYRWEIAVSLLFWGMRARDWSAVRQALREIRSRFTSRENLACLATAVAMRWPAFHGRLRKGSERGLMDGGSQ
ncbi:glycosyltransferase family 2 protein [Luteimonas vadosa]|uniref:Glycosyltransferase 2-like domain-containing protein n=1 Tax=Luteimonas vadosa TaxID=1165507 RepID=A0ABP9DPP8_9GAMM